MTYVDAIALLDLVKTINMQVDIGHSRRLPHPLSHVPETLTGSCISLSHYRRDSRPL